MRELTRKEGHKVDGISERLVFVRMWNDFQVSGFPRTMHPDDMKHAIEEVLRSLQPPGGASEHLVKWLTALFDGKKDHCPAFTGWALPASLLHLNDSAAGGSRSSPPRRFEFEVVPHNSDKWDTAKYV